MTTHESCSISWLLPHPLLHVASPTIHNSIVISLTDRCALLDIPKVPVLAVRGVEQTGLQADVATRDLRHLAAALYPEPAQ
jgi:hypothetical protein